MLVFKREDKKEPRLHADSSSTEAFAGDYPSNNTGPERECPVELTDQQLAALDRSITPARMSTYLSASHNNSDEARRLYLWDRRLSVAFFADLAILEIALRNAMNARLSEAWGDEWYANLSVPLDDRSALSLSASWARVTGPKAPGKLVAQCMFGFWRGLLDKGNHSGTAPRRLRCDYEILWRGVLDRAFPGGRAQAKSEGLRWNREYALAVVSRVNDLRNRVAHHEPLVNGFPLTGQKRRSTAHQAYSDCLRLARMLDRDLHALLEASSQVPSLLREDPRGHWLGDGSGPPLRTESVSKRGRY